jgi:hypothetical protein
MFLSADVIFMRDAYLEEHLETVFFIFILMLSVVIGL